MSIPLADVLVTADEDEVESDSDSAGATESDADTASDEDDLKVWLLHKTCFFLFKWTQSTTINFNLR